MNIDWQILWDPLFHIPWLAGCLAATFILPPIGVLLRLRDEWLAALGLAHLAGLSALAGLAIGIPTVLGAPVGGLIGILIKFVGNFPGNTIYVLMILIGWSCTLLIAANTPLGSVMGHALVEGQLFFATWIHLWINLCLGITIMLLWPWMSHHIIKACLFPGHNNQDSSVVWRWHLLFN
ncbi:hypothetical protein TI04_03835, partial [Achromatium sp. WMS2]